MGNDLLPRITKNIGGLRKPLCSHRRQCETRYQLPVFICLSCVVPKFHGNTPRDSPTRIPSIQVAVPVAGTPPQRPPPPPPCLRCRFSTTFTGESWSLTCPLPSWMPPSPWVTQVMTPDPRYYVCPLLTTRQGQSIKGP